MTDTIAAICDGAERNGEEGEGYCQRVGDEEVFGVVGVDVD